MTIVCCIGIVRLLNASNEMNHQRQQKLDVYPRSDEGSLIYLRGTEEDTQIWTQKLDEFLARERKKEKKVERN